MAVVQFEYYVQFTNVITSKTLQISYYPRIVDVQAYDAQQIILTTSHAVQLVPLPQQPVDVLVD